MVPEDLKRVRGLQRVSCTALTLHEVTLWCRKQLLYIKIPCAPGTNPTLSPTTTFTTTITIIFMIVISQQEYSV